LNQTVFLTSWGAPPLCQTVPGHDSPEAKSQDTYTDLTDVFIFPKITEVVACELRKRLDLLYTPVIRQFCNFGDA
jgi:hypothetical protein